MQSEMQRSNHRWCCCPRDYEATPRAPSLTTCDSRLPLLRCAPILLSSLCCVYKIMPILLLGQVTRWRMHHYSCGVRNMQCSPYFSMLLRQISVTSQNGRFGMYLCSGAKRRKRRFTLAYLAIEISFLPTQTPQSIGFTILSPCPQIYMHVGALDILFWNL